MKTITKEEADLAVIGALEELIKQIKDGELEATEFDCSFDWFPEPGCFIVVDPKLIGKTFRLHFRIIPQEEWPILVRG